MAFLLSSKWPAAARGARILAAAAVVFLLLASPLFGQEPIVNAYRVLHDSTLSATARSLTIQMPATISGGADTVRGMVGSAYCEAGTDLTIARDETAATETAATILPVSERTSSGQPTSTPVATAWTQKNDLGTGADVLNVIPIQGGQVQTFNLSHIRLEGAGTAKNFTISTGALSGRCLLWVMFQEY